MDLDHDEQQDHRTEATADAVEEGEAGHLDLAPCLLPHGQSSDGLMKDPRVERARFQKRFAA